MIHPALARRRRPWKITIPLVLVLVLAAAWSAFWFYAAGRAEAAIAAWFAEEAKAGRVHRCAAQSVGGFPFRIAFRCVEASIELTSMAPAQVLTMKDLVVMAQVYDPTLLIGEFTGPLTLAERGKPVALTVSWKLAQASMRGRPRAPERISIVLDEPTFERPAGNASESLIKAERMELHARRDPISTADNIALEIATKLVRATAPSLSQAAAQPLDADVVAVLRGLKDLAPKPVAVRLKELQAAGGKLDVTNARLVQGVTVVQAAGALGLSSAGRPDGTLRVTAAGLEQVLAAVGLDRVAAPAGLDRLTPSISALDRLGPGLGRIVPRPGVAQQPSVATGLLAFLGERAELDGKPAVALPLTFSDGKVMLGPLPLGQVAPLY